MVASMSLSRRQFFRRFLNPLEKSREERAARYQAMEDYARTQLLPYDFSLTEEQETELFSTLRVALEQTGDEELFSAIIRFKVDEVVDAKIRPWREDSETKNRIDRLNEIRNSAADYVSTFLSFQATPAAIEQLKYRVGIPDSKGLEEELRKRIEEWVEAVDDERLLQYDVFTVKDLVFGQLRSWC
jgi:hypothetical protein